MNRILKTITACALALVMTAISPMTDLSQSLGGTNDTTKAKASTIAKAAEADDANADGQLYISDIRLGNAYYDADDGPTEDQVVAELEEDGYIILKDGSDYADLNAGADAPSIKEGPNKKKILLGYKTTTDPDDAITDLAVMNMNGGYSVEEYQTLMRQQMDSQIKPFMDRFIATLNEYRENLKKPKDSVNYIRADKMRVYLNCFTDDDTGGKPIGDLLLNETKYEMGDAAYNKLSDSEKKDHADILTMLMQANGVSLLTIESLITQASDASGDTWYERFISTSLDDLVEEMKEKKKDIKTRADIYKALDKKYEDSAKLILKKWNDFQAKIQDYENAAEESLKDADKSSEKLDSIDFEDVENVTESDVDTFVETGSQIMYDVERTRDIFIATCLESTPYEGGSLYDFFMQDYKDISEGSAIRRLYPMVDALSTGQIAGLELVSLEDLFTMALAGQEGYEDIDKNLPEAVSVYEGVNREIYDQGGVALTSDALREKNLADDSENNIFGVSDMSTLLIVSWSATVATTGALAFSIVKALKAGKVGIKAAPTAGVAEKVIDLSVLPKTLQSHAFEKVAANWDNAAELAKTASSYEKFVGYLKDGEASPLIIKDYEGAIKELNNRIEYLKNNPNQADAAAQAGDKIDDVVDKADDAADGVSKGGMSGWSYLAIGLSLAVVVMITVSTIFTIRELKAYYRTNYVPIPKYIVDEVDITATNDKGERVMIQNQTAYYKVVTCNRIEGNSDVEKDNYKAMLDRNDVNGDIGKQWLALYAVKYKNGTPILADSLLYQRDSSSVPSGYSTGIHEFGGKAAANLNRKAYLYSSSPPSIHVYFKNAAPVANTSVEQTGTVSDDSADGQKNGDADVVGTIASKGAVESSGITSAGIAIGGGIGIALGALLMALIMYISRRKKVTIEK